VASKQAREETDVEELLDTVDKTLDRLKTLYEQYFLGIQKQAPSFIHNDIERKLRDLAQMQLRNTGLRYRLATLQQKFGSYNSYWRRTLRQIENGTYARQLSKIGRDAVRTGADIPDEILARMPKRMRDQVIRDREQALAIARRHQQIAEEGAEPPEADSDFIAMIKEPTDIRRKLKSTDGAHLLTNEDDFDIDAFFAEVEQRDDKVGEGPARSIEGDAKLGVKLGEGPARSIAEGDAKSNDKPSGPVTPARGRTTTRQPINRGRTTSTPPAYDDPERHTTRNDIVRMGTEPAGRGGSSPAIKRPGTHGDNTPPPPAPPRATPPPVPTRATSSIPAIKRPDTNLEEEPTNPNAFPAGRATGAQPALDPRTGRPVTPPAVPVARPRTPSGSTMASQASRPNPIAPGAAAARGPVQVESMQGPFPRSATPAQGVPAIPKTPHTGIVPTIPQTGVLPRIPGSAATPGAGTPAIPRPGTGAQPAIPRPPTAPTTAGTGPQPAIPRPGTGAQPAIPRPPTSQPVRPGTGPSAAIPSDMTGPHPQMPRPATAPSRMTPGQGVPAVGDPVIATRTPPAGATRTPAAGVPVKAPATGPRPAPAAPQKPPPGMTDADVNALYAKYVKAKEMVGEKIGPGEHNKLLKTINAQAPKIMEQYKAKGVDFSVVVKDNQVIIRAKPKT